MHVNYIVRWFFASTASAQRIASKYLSFSLLINVSLGPVFASSFILISFVSCRAVWIISRVDKEGRKEGRKEGTRRRGVLSLYVCLCHHYQQQSYTAAVAFVTPLNLTCAVSQTVEKNCKFQRSHFGMYYLPQGSERHRTHLCRRNCTKFKSRFFRVTSPWRWN